MPKKYTCKQLLLLNRLYSSNQVEIKWNQLVETLPLLSSPNAGTSKGFLGKSPCIGIGRLLKNQRLSTLWSQNDSLNAYISISVYILHFLFSIVKKFTTEILLFCNSTEHASICFCLNYVFPLTPASRKVVFLLMHMFFQKENK